MTGLASRAGAPPASDPVAAIRRFMEGASLEATRPKPGEVAALAPLLPPGTEMFLTAVPGRPAAEIVAAAVEVRRAGLEPVPHVAVRQHASLAALDDLLAALAGEAGVRRIMLIGGDVDPAGSVPNSLAVIESGLLGRRGLETAVVAGFPDGHPRLSDEDLELTLVTKVAALQQAGIEPRILTQFGFSALPVLRWLGWLDRRGIHVPVSVGFAGPTTLMRWLGYAKRCGVRASAEALASRSGLVRNVFRAVAPDGLIRAVAEGIGSVKGLEVRAHIFSFGGPVATARWAMAAARGEVRPTEDGFETPD